jgi:hypothetical protein
MLAALAAAGAIFLIALVFDVIGALPGHSWVFGVATIIVMGLVLAI